MLAPEADEREGLLLAERLRDEVNATFAREPAHLIDQLRGGELPGHGITSGELLHAADRARYEAKEAGRNRSVVFSHAHEPGAGGEKVGDRADSPRPRPARVAGRGSRSPQGLAGELPASGALRGAAGPWTATFRRSTSSGYASPRSCATSARSA